MQNPLSLAVVGHTNTGKTSLLRTLLRDSQFGEVKNAPATTRHVEEAAISDGSNTLVYLYDTPGLEDAGGVLDWLEANTSSRSDGIERLQQFLDSPEAAGDFNQEAKVLRQLLQSDMALYVVDAREPVLNKYKDELTVLSWCAKARDAGIQLYRKAGFKRMDNHAGTARTACLQRFRYCCL